MAVLKYILLETLDINRIQMLLFKWYTAWVKVPIKYTLTDVPQDQTTKDALNVSSVLFKTDILEWRVHWKFYRTTIYIWRDKL